MNTQVLQGLLVPFLGTTLGAALVFFLKRDLPEKVQKGLSGFAAGVMVAASIWSCLLYTSPSPRDAHESRMPSSA